MSEIVDHLLTSYHIPLLVSLGIFFLFALIGVLGVFDFDSDVELDMETETDLGGSGGNVFDALLKFLNASDIPLLLILAILNTIMLALSVLLNSFFNDEKELWLALVLYVPNFVVSVVLVHYVTKPFKGIFRQLKDDEPCAPVVGRVGEVKSLQMDQRHGQAEVPHDNEGPSKIHCVMAEGYEPLKRGDKIVVVSQIENENRYVAKPADFLLNE